MSNKGFDVSKNASSDLDHLTAIQARQEGMAVIKTNLKIPQANIEFDIWFLLERVMHPERKDAEKMAEGFISWLEWVVCDWCIWNGDQKVLPTQASMDEHKVKINGWLRDAVVSKVYEAVAPNHLLAVL
jgi:hypothetical protein